MLESHVVDAVVPVPELAPRLVELVTVPVLADVGGTSTSLHPHR